MNDTPDPAVQITDPAYADLLTRAALRKAIWQSDLSRLWKLWLLQMCDEADAYGMVTIDFAASATGLGVTAKRFGKRIRSMTERGYLRPVGKPSPAIGMFYLATRP